MRFRFILLTCLLLPISAFGQSEVELGIKSSYAQRIPLNVAPFAAVDGTRPDQALSLESLVTADLEFSGLFDLKRKRVPLAANGDKEGLVEVRGALIKYKGETHFEGRVIDVSTKQQIGGKRYRLKEDQTRQIAHHFADEIVRMLTGENGIAGTQILYRRKTPDQWEIIMSDYDGHNPRVLLRQSVPLIYPRWLDQDRALVYSSFRYGKPDLFIRNLSEPASKRLSSYDGLNYSVDWSETRRELAATLSKDGNAEIYIMNTDGKVKRRLTHNRAIDCSPSWAPSGREILFTSDRPGSPQLYIMESDGSNVRRLTFQGSYNASPAWSPKGDLIAFASRIDGFFQLCTIRPDGTDLRVLTTEASNHEDPRWAPNGRHIVYGEERGGESAITIIDIGTGGRRILAGGDSADWSVR
ncbi:MAG: Tol-Pal system beta propeller repeat protein TolB [Candidatus Krumholzibacteria bacterium]|nr:Tol-Pal system beta propeller repeat protein TolB [Candidatus Krumholzibacteria bacterium]